MHSFEVSRTPSAIESMETWPFFQEDREASLASTEHAAENLSSLCSKYGCLGLLLATAAGCLVS